jgi:hypothetical protein
VVSELFSPELATDSQDFNDRSTALRNLNYPDLSRSIDVSHYASIAKAYKGHPGRFPKKPKSGGSWPFAPEKPPQFPWILLPEDRLHVLRRKTRWNR